MTWTSGGDEEQDEMPGGYDAPRQQDLHHGVWVDVSVHEWNRRRTQGRLVPVTAEAKKIFEEALALPEQERVALLDALAESILDDGGGDLSPEWKAEVARRIEAVERGESRLIPGDEVEARIQETLGRV